MIRYYRNGMSVVRVAMHADERIRWLRVESWMDQYQYVRCGRTAYWIRRVFWSVARQFGFGKQIKGSTRFEPAPEGD